MAKYLTANGDSTEVSPAGKEFTLQELQGFVGGYIEMYPLKNGTVMVLNEEGKLKNLPRNPIATFELFGSYTRDRITGDYICGDVLFCTRAEAGYETDDEDEEDEEG